MHHLSFFSVTYKKPRNRAVFAYFLLSLFFSSLSVIFHPQTLFFGQSAVSAAVSNKKVPSPGLLRERDIGEEYIKCWILLDYKAVAVIAPVLLTAILYLVPFGLSSTMPSDTTSKAFFLSV